MKYNKRSVLAVSVAVGIGLLAALFAVVVARRAHDPLTRGLVAYYPFNGDAQDASGNRNHGTVSGATLTTNRFSSPNSAFYFSGKGGHISVPDSPTLGGTNGLSLTAWITVEPGGMEQPRILHKHVFDLGLSDRSGTPQVFFNISRLEDGVATVKTSPISSNQWVFLAGTYDRQTLRLYTNGVLAAQTNTSIPIELSDLPIGIGRNLESNSDWFKGCMDDVRIYNRALSEAEVRQLYQLR
jgi:hypothetical protein